MRVRASRLLGLSVTCSALLAARSYAWGAGAGSVAGTVKLPDGKPAEGTLVFIDGYELRALTGKDGKFQIKNVPSGLNAVVALLRGHKPGRRLNLEVKRGQRLEHVNFTLEIDPDYRPDTFTIKELAPAAESILPPNTDTTFSGVIEYNLRNHRSAKIVIAFQDDRHNPLLSYQPQYDIKRGAAAFSFRRVVRTPARFGTADMYMSIAIVPFYGAPIESSEIITYQVRNFKDDLRFGAVALSASENRSDQVTVSTAVDFALDTVARGTLRFRVVGDEGKSDYSHTLLEQTRALEKSVAASGAATFSGTCSVPPKVKFLKVRVDLLSADSPDPKLVKYSRAFPRPSGNPKQD